MTFGSLLLDASRSLTDYFTLSLSLPHPVSSDSLLIHILVALKSLSTSLLKKSRPSLFLFVVALKVGREGRNKTDRTKTRGMKERNLEVFHRTVLSTEVIIIFVSVSSSFIPEILNQAIFVGKIQECKKKLNPFLDFLPTQAIETSKINKSLFDCKVIVDCDLLLVS